MLKNKLDKVDKGIFLIKNNKFNNLDKFMKSNKLKILGGVILIALTMGVIVIFGYTKYQNRETIVDLGDGWKSYHHNKIGMTVKAPEDAEQHKETFYISNIFKIVFSNGLIKNIGSGWIRTADKTQNKEKVFQDNLESFRRYYSTQKIPTKEYCQNDDKVGKRCFIHQHEIGSEIKIKDKIGFVQYDIKKCTECVDCKNNNSECMIDRNASVEIPGYKRCHFFNINTSLLYKQNPYLKDIPFEKLGEEYIKLTEPYILEVDNF
jgi:hypothetical protein